MLVSDIVTRVQSLLDDPEGTFITSDYVIGFAQHEYEKLYGKLKNIGSSFDNIRVELPAVPAGTRELDDYMAQGKPLEMLVQPRILEWKPAGAEDTMYRNVTGPLNQVRDVPEGNQHIDSWAYVRRSIKLAKFAADLDLRLTGEFLFEPLIGPDSPIEIGPLCNVTLACQLGAAIGKARGNQGWITNYTADAIDAFDDLALALNRAEQAKTRRLARISHQVPATGFTVKSS